MPGAGRARTIWLAAAAGGLALGAVCLAFVLLPPETALGDGKSDAPAARITFDPALKVERRSTGPSQQFEIRLRLVLPRNPRGHSIGVRHTVGVERASMGQFVRVSARLPGPARGPRPYLELSLITRSR